MNAVNAPRVSDLSLERRQGRTLGRLWAVGTIVAVILVTGTFEIAVRFSGPLVVSGTSEVAIGNVIGMTIIGTALGAVSAYGIGRLARRPQRVFLIWASIALAAYSVVPFTAAESVESALWLNVFHLVVAAPVIGVLTRYLAPLSGQRPGN